MNKLAPIILFAYNRPWHTEQVLQALKENELADQSHLIVFVDGVKDNATSADIKQNQQVIEIARSQKWCGSIEVHISEYNHGCRWAPINGISYVLSEYPSCIILEDDILTSPYFLTYMNKALQFYENYQSVFSISAFNLSEKAIPIPEDYDYDVYVSLRQLNWGWGTWANRWNLVNWEKDNIPLFIDDKQQVDAFNRGGDDLSQMLLDEFDGKSQAWDIQFSFAQFYYHAVSIVPCYSYTQNIGLDNSGTHTLNNIGGSFVADLSKAVLEPRLLPIIYEDKRIVNHFYNVFSTKKRPLWQKVFNRLNRLLGGKNIFVVKKKIYD